jgi:hypothetical protein
LNVSSSDVESGSRPDPIRLAQAASWVDGDVKADSMSGVQSAAHDDRAISRQWQTLAKYFLTLP